MSFTPTARKRISIHGLRVEPDAMLRCAPPFLCISIHGLRVEPDVFAVA